VSTLATLLFRGTRRIDALDPGDRGLAYGDGLFETARVHDGLVVWWPGHLARLSEGAARLRIPMPDVAWLASQLAGFVAQAPARAVLKAVLTRGVGGRGYAPPDTVEPTLALSLHAAPARAAAPLVLRWCDTRLAIQPALAGLKHLNRLEQVLARAEWTDPAIHEGLMLDSEGWLGCATAANVFALRDGRWLTPPVHRRGVAGVARAWVLANEPGAAEAELTREQVESADALFLCNAVRGILPVGRLGDRSWSPHPALLALQRRLGRSEPAFDPGS
jgi:4-amino-4-deoxychorismate lyase